MLAHGTGLCYIEEAFHAFYKEALGLTKLSARERARIGLLALIIAAAVLSAGAGVGFSSLLQPARTVSARNNMVTVFFIRISV